MAVDSHGNTFVTGVFGGPTLTFGTCPTCTLTAFSVGAGDIFVAKYDPQGVCLWAARAGGTSHDAANPV